MAGISSGWRRVAGAMVALLVAVLVLGPPIDAFACEAEAVATAVQPAGGQARVTTADIHADHHGAAVAGACVHGVCVHAPCGLPASGPVCLAPRHGEAVHALEPLASSRSAPDFGLKRPPRA